MYYSINNCIIVVVETMAHGIFHASLDVGLELTELHPCLPSKC